VTAVATRSVETEAAPQGVNRAVLAVFSGLMLGSLIASLNTATLLNREVPLRQTAHVAAGRKAQAPAV